jgi:hypothetical protein
MRFSVRRMMIATAAVAGLLGSWCGYHLRRAEWHALQAKECGDQADAIAEHFLRNWDRYNRCPEGPARDPLMGPRVALVKNRIYHTSLRRRHLEAVARPWSYFGSAAPPPPPRPPASVTADL